jgi:hypothetical protein
MSKKNEDVLERERTPEDVDRQLADGAIGADEREQRRPGDQTRGEPQVPSHVARRVVIGTATVPRCSHSPRRLGGGT